MKRPLKAFEVDINGTPFDYRTGDEANLETVRDFLSVSYDVKKLWNGGRHVLGILTKGDHELFLKLSTTVGIGELTKNEYSWNEIFNRLVPASSPFAVPVNVEQGYSADGQYFCITRLFKGASLAARPEPEADASELIRLIPDIIGFAETISSLPIKDSTDHRRTFLTKVRAWYEAIPMGIRNEYTVSNLLDLVVTGAESLDKKPRHGDFAPWHLMTLNSGQLGLLDGEHFMPGGVEYYDICYFIQRVFTVLESPELAQKILRILIRRGYDKKKLQAILAARGIGGFLDASLAGASDLSSEKAFQTWVRSL